MSYCYQQHYFQMSNLQNQAILESLFESALEELTNDNPLGFNAEELQFSAECLAQERFEEELDDIHFSILKESEGDFKLSKEDKEEIHKLASKRAIKRFEELA